MVKEETEQALSWKQDSILGGTVDFERCAQPVSMETTYQLENQAPEGRALGLVPRLSEA